MKGDLQLVLDDMVRAMIEVEKPEYAKWVEIEKRLLNTRIKACNLILCEPIHDLESDCDDPGAEKATETNKADRVKDSKECAAACARKAAEAQQAAAEAQEAARKANEHAHTFVENQAAYGH